MFASSSRSIFLNFFPFPLSLSAFIIFHHFAECGCNVGFKFFFFGWNGGYGNYIILSHGNGITTRYAHASQLYVTAGQTVSKGQVIAAVGTTGNSTGPHLHFEVRVNGSHTNPLNYL